jgi:hypothetical protein
MVAMVQPTESWMCHDHATLELRPRTQSPSRRLLAESKVCAVFLVVINVIAEQASEMTLAANDDVVFSALVTTHAALVEELPCRR